MKVTRVKPLQPRSLEISYTKQIQRTVDAWSEAVIRYQNLLPDGHQRMDGYFEDAMNLFLRAVTKDWQAVLDTVPFTKIFADTSLYKWRQWKRQVDKGTKVTLPTVQPFNEPGIARLADRWIAGNITRIKGFKEERDQQLQDLIFDGVSKGLGRQQLADKILPSVKALNATVAGRTRLSAEARAELIATDQILTASSQLDEQRMRNAHVAYYAWEGMDDGRERPAHLLLNDNIFRLDGLPMTDEDLRRVGRPNQQMRTPGAEIAPGIPVRCRCYRSPLFDGSDYDVD